VNNVSDELPDSLRLKLYKKYVSAITRKSSEVDKTRVEKPEDVVWSKLTDEKARELMNKLKALYPDIYQVLVGELYKLLKDGVLKELDGLTVYSIIKALGLNIRPDIRIKFVKDGKEVDLDEYMK
jgi:DNA-binding TFAR19-related protein (PDSD5 family)